MNETILVVDDNPELVDGLKLTLEMEGYQVLPALSGEAALGVLERITPDLILADIMMPRLDGYELYIRVHHNPRWVQIPFIFLTAKTSKEDVRKGKEMGADDYITKPFDPQDVVAAVRGKLKRMGELEVQPSPANFSRTLGNLWRSKVGVVPMPVVIALLALALALAPLAMLFNAFRQGAALAPLRPDVGTMIAIPAGDFWMGSQSPGGPQWHEINLPTFEIDKHEVTVEQYNVFVTETGRAAPWGSYPAERADHPVTNVTWEDAAAYCEWAGKRLPTEAEWEKAARGEEGFVYPWGAEWSEGRANTLELGIGGTQAVGSYPEGASPYGALDMAGNVYEWVADWSDASQNTRVIRGGAWNARLDWAQTFQRNTARPIETRDNLGFRCARF